MSDGSVNVSLEELVASAHQILTVRWADPPADVRQVEFEVTTAQGDRRAGVYSARLSRFTVTDTVWGPPAPRTLEVAAADRRRSRRPPRARW